MAQENDELTIEPHKLKDHTQWYIAQKSRAATSI